MRASAMLNTTGYGVPPGGYPGAAQFPVDPRLSMIGGLNSSMASLGGLGSDAVLFNELAQRIRYASREQSSVYGPHGSLHQLLRSEQVHDRPAIYLQKRVCELTHKPCRIKVQAVHGPCGTGKDSTPE